jgi:hypothetical protein
MVNLVGNGMGGCWAASQRQARNRTAFVRVTGPASFAACAGRRGPNICPI